VFFAEFPRERRVAAREESRLERVGAPGPGEGLAEPGEHDGPGKIGVRQREKTFKCGGGFRGAAGLQVQVSEKRERVVGEAGMRIAERDVGERLGVARRLRGPERLPGDGIRVTSCRRPALGRPRCDPAEAKLEHAHVARRRGALALDGHQGIRSLLGLREDLERLPVLSGGGERVGAAHELIDAGIDPQEGGAFLVVVFLRKRKCGESGAYKDGGESCGLVHHDLRSRELPGPSSLQHPEDLTQDPLGCNK